MSNLVGKWAWLDLRDKNFLTGEIVAQHIDCFEFRRDPSPDELAGFPIEPSHTQLFPIEVLTNDGSRLFESEADLRAWLEWASRPETLSEARKRLRPS